MAEQTKLSLQRISVFMPHRLTDVEARLLFFARQPLFNRLVQRILQEDEDSIPQHYLIIGVRGMGKTMLLRRLAAELRTEKMQERFIGLNFPEEQYNLDRLSKFWLNAIDALADTLQTEGQEATADELDIEVDKIEALKNEAERSQQAYQLLVNLCKKLNRRPVFLIDNLNLVFARLSDIEHSQIRRLITSPDAPIFVGASSDLVKDDYQAPFYDAFDIEYLYKLDFQQTLALLQYLAEVTDQVQFKSLIYQNSARLETLHQLTGGNLRTLIILFQLVVKDFTQPDIYQDLEALVDMMTPAYKAQFEELSAQAQVVLDAVALNWNPANLDTIRERTGLESGGVSANLDRLQKAGWIQRLGTRKNATYEICERFFNVWYLMRRSSRRQARDLRWLTDFLQGWFDKKEVRSILKNQQQRIGELNQNDVSYYLAMSRTIDGTKSGQTAKEDLYKRLIVLCEGDKERVKDLMGVKIEEIKEEWFEDYRKKQSKNNIVEKPVISFEQKITEEQRIIAKLKFNEAFEAHKENDWVKAERLYLEALPHFSKPELLWNNLGIIFKELEKYYKAEEAYRKAIIINENYSYPWTNLGNILKYLGRYEEAEKAFRKVIDIDGNYSYPYNGLGILLNILGRYDEAEKAYRKAIEIDRRSENAWNGLGNALTNLNRYEEAEEAYQTSIKIAPNDICPKANLVSLYRDKLNKIQEAKYLFEESKYLYAEQDAQDAECLSDAVFAAYQQNWGLSADYWKKALGVIDDKLKNTTIEYWQRSAAITVKLGYGQKLVEIFEQTGHHRIFRPLYEAIKALTINSEEYLRTQVAAEVREVALQMFAFMKKYNEHTAK